MSRGLLETQQSLEKLKLSSAGAAALAASNRGSFTLNAPENNVTLVLNFGNGFSPPAGVPISFGGSNNSHMFAHQSSLSSITTGESLSPSTESRSPSESSSSSTPSTPELNRSTVKEVSSTTSKQVLRQSHSSGSRKVAPSKETLDRFLNSQVQVHSTVSLSESHGNDVYSESWIKKKHYLSFTKHHKIRDVKFDGDCNVILTSRHSVQLYDANGHFMERLYLDKIQEPWGIHIHDNGNVFVSDHKNDCVKEFTHIGIQLMEYGPVPAPCGVTVSSSNFVFVCSQSDRCVYVFDKNNKIVKKLGLGTLTSPAHIALYGKLVLVSDEARIIGFTTENAISFAYGHSDTTNHPACLTIDRKTGFVLATSYYKSSIIAIKKDMSRALMVKESTRPILCALSPYGHLLVGERLSKGVQFKMYRAGKDII
ncbi:hypothetical protein EB796_015923 [Bugula neritina]|uniref:Uncharacterized protein n=1 Tax=Bugula neritina TaxID=10212 RepID=A0A7J7JH47_BUGNE|nr:hypothetical protein EB796_015923 [Bugula neritina]